MAAVIALLRTAQLPAGMGALDMTMSGAGVGVWVALSVVPAAVIGLLGPAGPATGVARGLVIGLLWWVSWNLTLLPVMLGVRPGWSSASVTVGFADPGGDPPARCGDRARLVGRGRPRGRRRTGTRRGPS